MSTDTRWDVWTRDEETLYAEFVKSHVEGTPWPIEQMDLAAVNRNLRCRPFTQHVLELKALLEWRKEKAEEEERKREKGKSIEGKRKLEMKGTELPEIHITDPSGAFEHKIPLGSEEDSYPPRDVPIDGLTPPEWSIYIEFANNQRLHTPWPIELMERSARQRGLICNTFTQEKLNREFMNHPRYRPPLPAGDPVRKPRRKVMTLGEARKSAFQQMGADEGICEPMDG